MTEMTEVTPELLDTIDRVKSYVPVAEPHTADLTAIK
jgi:hypothetical protein